jgi:hypothetical protein
LASKLSLLLASFQIYRVCHFGKYVLGYCALFFRVPLHLALEILLSIHPIMNEGSKNGSNSTQKALRALDLFWIQFPWGYTIFLENPDSLLCKVASAASPLSSLGIFAARELYHEY